jgi:DivIVA domain-containing protein
MPLTPADVHNVAFKKPPIGKRGYDEEEVDAFLDEVERELVSSGEQRTARTAGARRWPGRSGGSGSTRDWPRRTPNSSRRWTACSGTGAGRQAARAMQAELEQIRARGRGRRGRRAAGARVLMMAQRTADDHVNDARRRPTNCSPTRAKAEGSPAVAGQGRSARTDAQRHQEAMGGLDAKRSALQQHIEALKRTSGSTAQRLKAYLESQLRDLEATAEPETEMTRGGRATPGGSGVRGRPGRLVRRGTLGARRRQSLGEGTGAGALCAGKGGGP